MRFWDRLTGGALAVTVELDKPMYLQNEPINVKATVTANDDCESGFAVITLVGDEEVQYEVPVFDSQGQQQGTNDQTDSTQTLRVEARVPGPFQLAKGEQKVIEGQITVPFNAPPSYDGRKARHRYQVTFALDVSASANPSETVDVVIGLAGG